MMGGIPSLRAGATGAAGSVGTSFNQKIYQTYEVSFLPGQYFTLLRRPGRSKGKIVKNFNAGSFIIKITRYTLLYFLFGMLGFEMEDRSPPGVCLNSYQEAKELILGDENFKYQLEEFRKSGRNEMTILLCGKTGVGKSHLTNALIGENLAEEGHTLSSRTAEVSGFTTI